MKLGIPLADASVDKVVVCPTFRRTFPIGNHLTPQDVAAPRMAQVLRESIRVLKSGGTLNILAVRPDAHLARADLLELGCQDIEIFFLIDPEAEGGSSPSSDVVPLFTSCSYIVKWAKPSKNDNSTSGDAAACIPASAATAVEMAMGHNTSSIDDSPLLHDAGINHHHHQSRSNHSSHARRNSILFFVYQTCVFLALTIIAASLFEVLDFPTSINDHEIVGTGRANSVLVGIALHYPVFACFIHHLDEFKESPRKKTKQQASSFMAHFAGKAPRDAKTLGFTVVYMLCCLGINLPLQVALRTSGAFGGTMLLCCAVSAVWLLWFRYCHRELKRRTSHLPEVEIKKINGLVYPE